jgi:excisionase family DNA binding protein
MVITSCAAAAAPATEALLVDAREAARLLGLSARTIWSLTQRRELPCRRIGRRVLYSRAALAAYAEGRPL